MDFNIKELKLLFTGLTKLSANEENWELQEKIIKEIEILEKE